MSIVRPRSSFEYIGQNAADAFQILGNSHGIHAADLRRRKAWSALSQDEINKIMADYGNLYTQEVIAAGIMRGGSS